MKQFLVLIALGVLCGTLFAQDIPEDAQSEFYYVSVPIERIYSYRKGYIVQYRKGINQIATTYIPLEWFEGTANKADLINIGSGQMWPHMTVYYKNKEFDHVRIFVRRERGHETWGQVPLTVNIDDRFTNTTTLELEF